MPKTRCFIPRTCLFLAIAALALGLPPVAPASTVSVYPLPSLYSQSTSYSLKANGTNVPVVSYVGEYDYAQFSMAAGPVTLELTASTQGSISSYRISPLKLGLSGSTAGNKLTFTLTNNHYLIVQINSVKRLIIAADPEETDVPPSSGTGIFNVTALPYGADNTGSTKTTAAIQSAINDASAYGNVNGQGIVYLPAGVYRSGNLQFPGNVAFYMEGGSVIRATDDPADYINHWFKNSQNHYVTWFLHTTIGASNVRMYGRGTIDANGYYLANTMDYGINFLVPVGCTNFTVDGITFRDSGSWGILTARSANLAFYNLKIFNHLNTGEDDGIDICESQNVVVSNAVTIALDDPYSTKTWANGTDIAVNWPGPAQMNSNIVFDKCLSWTYCYAFKVGQGAMQPQNGITYRNSVAYDCAVALGIDHKYGTATVANVTFENIDVERVSNVNAGHRTWAAFFVENALGDGGGPITNLVVRNINVRDRGTSGAVLSGFSDTAAIRDVVYENIYMPGSNSPAANLFQMDVTHVLFASNITVLPLQIPEPPRPGDNGIYIDFENPVYVVGNMADSTAPGATNAAMIGQQGWSQSTSGGPGAIVTTTTSGLYTGGQALGSGDSGNAYIGANKKLVLGKKYRFDLRAPAGNKAGVAGFADLNGDGLFSQAESGVAAGVADSGGVSYFGFRDQIAGGTIYSSGVTAGTTNWYRITVTLDDATRTATMDVTNLTAGGTVVDLNGAAAGASFSHTWPAGQWISPTNFAGVIGRASASLQIDNIVLLEPAVNTPVTLQVAKLVTGFQLNWPRGILLEATNIAGPWTTNLSASPPFSLTPDAPQRFYRLLLQAP